MVYEESNAMKKIIDLLIMKFTSRHLCKRKPRWIKCSMWWLRILSSKSKICQKEKTFSSFSDSQDYFNGKKQIVNLSVECLAYLGSLLMKTMAEEKNVVVRDNSEFENRDESIIKAYCRNLKLTGFQQMEDCQQNLQPKISRK